jgi:hypothetical protein
MTQVLSFTIFLAILVKNDPAEKSGLLPTLSLCIQMWLHD